MDVAWDIVEAGPAAAESTVLLLPGGMCSARQYREVMSTAALAGTRTVAVTLPGHCGAAPLEDFRTETYARAVGALAREINADVVVGFSMGAMVAYEMVVSGAFGGPTILVGPSLSAKDEPAFFRAIIRLGAVLGTLPVAVLKQGAASMVRRVAVPPDRRGELAADFARNDAHDLRGALQGYLQWLQRDDDPASRLCAADVPVWVVHAEKGDGALTSHEREVLSACPHAHVMTLPGESFFLPVEAPDVVANLITDALASSGPR